MSDVLDHTGWDVTTMRTIIDGWVVNEGSVGDAEKVLVTKNGIDYQVDVKILKKRSWRVRQDHGFVLVLPRKWWTPVKQRKLL